MRRVVVGLAVAVALAVGPVAAQDAAAAQRYAEQITSQSAAFLPDAQVTASRAALFRGALEPARAALEQLAALGEPAVPALAQLLRHASAQVRANAAYGLGLVGGPAVVGALQGAADDPNAGVRYQVAQALGFTGSAQALVALNKLAGDADGAVRGAAIQTGATLRDILSAEQCETQDAKFAELVKLTPNEAAVRALARYGAAAVPALLTGLDSEDPGVQAGSAHALARIGDPRGLEPLWSHFQASLTKTPATVFAQALGEYRSPEVFPYLAKLLDTPEVDAVPLAQYYALDRMATIDHPDRLKELNGFLQRMIAKGAHKEVVRGPETDVSPVAEACGVLAKVGDKSSLPLLDQVIGEAPPPEKSIVKPMAQRAKAAIEKRGA